MPIDMRTHGLDWKARLRASAIFAPIVTPAWHTDRRCQAQYAYAKTLGKTIVLLVKQGTRLPPDADRYPWHVWTTTEELADLVSTLVRQGPRGEVRQGRERAAFCTS